VVALDLTFQLPPHGERRNSKSFLYFFPFFEPSPTPGLTFSRLLYEDRFSNSASRFTPPCSASQIFFFFRCRGFFPSFGYSGTRLCFFSWFDFPPGDRDSYRVRTASKRTPVEPSRVPIPGQKIDSPMDLLARNTPFLDANGLFSPSRSTPFRTVTRFSFPPERDPLVAVQIVPPVAEN